MLIFFDRIKEDGITPFKKEEDKKRLDKDE